MQKLSVSQAAEHLGISREAVYNRIRRNTLQSIIENGAKFVLLDTNEKPNKQTNKTQLVKQHKIVSDERYIDFLKQTIEELKYKVTKLEREKDELIKQKEELLKETKNEIEKTYKDKDKQLKQVLTLVAKPLLTYMRKHEAIDAEFEDLTPYEKELIITPKQEKWQNLEEYMEQKGYSYKKKKSINTAIVAQIGKNKNIKEENGFLFIKRGKKIKQLLRNKS